MLSDFELYESAFQGYDGVEIYFTWGRNDRIYCIFSRFKFELMSVSCELALKFFSRFSPQKNLL